MKRTIKLIVPVCCLLALFYIFCPKPELKEFQNYSRAYLDRHGTLLRLTLAQDERYRLYTPLAKISPLVQEATILYEDQHFYRHAGIDIPALVRAFWATLVGPRKIGASTITMQVARLRWGIKSSSMGGKTIQILRALQLTRHYSKKEILETYFNLAPYGRNVEGIAAASLIYFNKQATDLSLPEALTLSVIPQNPSRRNPTQAKGYAKLLKAREILFQRWLEKHPGDKKKHLFMEMPLTVRSPNHLPFLAPHFITDLETNLPPRQHGVIRTTIDLATQKAMENIISGYVARRRHDGIKNAVAMLINYKSMEIDALVGSANFFDSAIAGQVNGATAKRSPGSALKPFLYGLAMDQGLIHPMTLLKDAPQRFAGFTPENFDQRFMGPIFARDALIASRNVPAVRLQARLQQPNFYDFLQQSEVSDLKKEEFYGLALALGGVELSMEELARLYTILPNQGLLRRIKKIIPNSPSIPEKDQRLLSREASFLTLDILKDSPPPLAAENSKLNGQVGRNPDIAWKTGTSFAFRDAWAIGVSGPYVLAVWVGNFRGDGNPSFIGRTAAGPLLFELLDAVTDDKEPPWRVTDTVYQGLLNIKKVAVCGKTGNLPGRYCPKTKQTWFIPGVSPIKVSSLHRRIPVDKTTGLRSCWFDPQKSVLRTYEFWPSDLLSIYNLAGIGLKLPPTFNEDCSLNDKSSFGLPPVIKSPQNNIIYALQSNKLGTERIPFSAIVDADVRYIYWFVDNHFAGLAKKDELFFWQPKSGTFKVRVVDDSGRASETMMTAKLVR